MKSSKSIKKRTLLSRLGLKSNSQKKLSDAYGVEDTINYLNELADNHLRRFPVSAFLHDIYYFKKVEDGYLEYDIVDTTDPRPGVSNSNKWKKIIGVHKDLGRAEIDSRQWLFSRRRINLNRLLEGSPYLKGYKMILEKGSLIEGGSYVNLYIEPSEHRDSKTELSKETKQILEEWYDFDEERWSIGLFGAEKPCFFDVGRVDGSGDIDGGQKFFNALHHLFTLIKNDQKAYYCIEEGSEYFSRTSDSKALNFLYNGCPAGYKLAKEKSYMKNGKNFDPFDRYNNRLE